MPLVIKEYVGAKPEEVNDKKTTITEACKKSKKKGGKKK